MNFNFSANGVDFGDYEGATEAQAKESFAKDAGYASWEYMCQEAGNEVEVTEVAE